MSTSNTSEDVAERNRKYPEGFQWPANERPLLAWVLGVMTVLQVQKTLVNLDVQTGGCAFTEYLLAYLLIALLVGMPVIFLEMYSSQYSSRGGVSSWAICPLFRGIGYGKLLTLLVFQAYYNCLVALLLLYCVRSITERNSWRCDGDAGDCFDFNGTKGINEGYRTPTERYYLQEIVNSAPQLSQDWHWEWIGSVIASTALAFFGCCLGCRFLGRMLAICLGTSFMQGLLLLCASNVTMGGLQGAERLVKSVQQIGWTHLLKPWVPHSTTLEAFRDLNIGIGTGLGMFSTIAATRPFRSGIHSNAIRLNLIHLEDLLLQSILTANLYGILCHYANLDMDQVISSGTSERRPSTLQSLSVAELPNDVFTIMPHALAFLYGSNFFWIFTYYSSVFLRGVCCMALMIHAVVQEIHEWKPTLLRANWFLSSLLVTLAATLFSCFIISTGGMPFIALLHECIRQLILPCLISCELFALLYFYGTFEIARDVHFMLGIKMSKCCMLLLLLCSLIVPLLSVISIYRFYQVGGDKYFHGYHKYLLTAVLSWIPFMALVRVIRKKSWRDVVRPNKDWGPPTNYLRISRSKFKNKYDFNIQEYIYEKHLKRNKMNKYD